MKFDRESIELALKLEGVTNFEFWINLFLMAGIPDGYYTPKGFTSVMTDFITGVNKLAKNTKRT